MKVLVFIAGHSPDADELDLARTHDTKMFRTLLESAYPVEAHDLAVSLHPEEIPEGYNIDATKVGEVATEEVDGAGPEGSREEEEAEDKDATGASKTPDGSTPWGANLPGKAAV